ncbi:MAG: PIN domain-containing protein [Pseudomonadota bacterium]
MAEGDGAPERWFLDACVLYPLMLRGILMGIGRAGVVRPFWSARVLEEWRIAAARKGGMAAEAEVRWAAEALANTFPGGEVVPDEAVEATLRLPDAADVHVAAGAAAARARIITFNIRDFPARRLRAYGLDVEHPDAALWRLHGSAGATVMGAVASTLEVMDRSEGSTGVRTALKRAGLPRLGKALG